MIGITAMDKCIVAECPVQNQPAGCGFLAVGTPCGHPRWRERWQAARAAAQGPEPQPTSIVQKRVRAQEEE